MRFELSKFLSLIFFQVEEEATSLFEKTTITFDEDRGSSDYDELEKTIFVQSSEDEKVCSFS